MNITVLNVPGKLPTVIYDPGKWTNEVSKELEKLEVFSANYYWWKVFFSNKTAKLIHANISVIHRMIHKMRRVNLKSIAVDSSKALLSLMDSETFKSHENYIDTIKRLYHYIDQWNKAKTGFGVDLISGISVNNLNYQSLDEIIEYSEKDSLLYKLTGEALSKMRVIPDFLVMNLTSPEDLLTALICARIMREKNPGMYICIADHGYENFSLHNHMDRLKEEKLLFEVLDSIIGSKEHVDYILPRLITRVRNSERPKGVLDKKDFKNILHPKHNVHTLIPNVPTFTCSDVLWTRLSDKKCYWSKCTFCVQNVKYDHEYTGVSTDEIDESLERLNTFIKNGYENIIFSDEAISPKTLSYLSQKILEKGMKFNWTCRCRIEKDFSKDLLHKMKKAGCFEVLFGLETISLRIQKKMNKYQEEIEKEFIRGLFENINHAGMGLHINFIVGFPGETLLDLDENINFAINSLKNLENTTYLLNEFTLFKGSIISREPDKFSIDIIKTSGNMPFVLDYGFKTEIEEVSQITWKMIPKLSELVYDKLGWSQYGLDIGSLKAIYLYFTSGHGSIFKTMERNPFRNPLYY